MKTYQSPEVKNLHVNAQAFLCASPAAPQRQGQLGTMSVTEVTEW